MNRFRNADLTKILYFAVIISIATLIYIVVSNFSASEATVVNGKTSDINTDWVLVEKNKEDEITLPKAVYAEPSGIKIKKTLGAENSGLTMELYANNAYVTATVDNNVIYDEYPEDKRNTEERTVNLIDLPLYTETKDIIITLKPVNEKRTIFIRNAAVMRKETAIIKQLKESLIQLFCCVLLILCAGLSFILEIVRKHSRWEERYLFRFSLLAFTILSYCLIKSGTPTMFFGNDIVFESVGNVSLAFMPLFAASFYNIEKNSEVGRYITTAALFSGITCTAVNATPWNLFGYAKWILIILLAAVTIFYLISEIGSKLWQVEIIGLASSLLFCFMALLSDMSVFSGWGRIAEVILITLFICIMTYYQAYLLVEDYREEIEESEMEAIRANEAKGKFLASMSHEIRTPINAVLGMNEMILRESNEQEIKNYAADIDSAGHNLLSIINDILDLSKIESGKMEILPEEYDISSMIHDTINMIIPKANGKGLRFDVSVDPQMPSKLYGDDVRIRQIMVNLLSNAVKYTEKGKVRLKISWKANKSGTYMMYCEVKDTGVGIKEEDLPKLFAEFERIEERKHKTTEGTGLGMSITVKMLSLMGSKLRVKSEYGTGTTFWFYLKQKIVDKTPVGDFNERIKERANNYSYESSFSAPDAKILVVDDNRMNLKVFTSLLKQTGINITEAISGKECLNLTAKEHYDMIFLDHMMPDMDGIETLKRLKASERNKCRDVPIYALTANAISGAREEYLRAGFDGFISKPIVSKELEKVIRENLSEEVVKPAMKIPKKVKSISQRTIPEIEGIDMNYAKCHFSDDKTLYEALLEFQRSADLQIRQLNGMYDKVINGNNFEPYRIYVHSLKSLSGMIGQVQLQGLCKTLEDSAKHEDISEIMSMHPVLEREWVMFNEKLSKALKIPAKKQTKQVGDKERKMLYIKLKSAMEALDIDSADETMQRISDIKTEQNERLINDLEICVSNLDSDGAIEILKELIKKDI